VKSRWIKTVFFALLGLAPALTAMAQSSYPAKTVRLITAIPIGADIYVRVLGTRLTDLLGQQVIIENRIGGSQSVAVQSVANAPPDGHTLLIQSVAALISKSVNPKREFDPVGDFAAVAKIYEGGASALVVRSESAARSIEDIVSLAKASPGKLSYGATERGSLSHLSTELFIFATNTEVFHVPFKTPADYLKAMLRGDVDFAIVATTQSMPQIKAGKVRALGVTSAARCSYTARTAEERSSYSGELGRAGCASQNTRGNRATAQR
jgi:tripartite-type tricarboxylate transporter receptor subunit TctC